MRPLSYDETGGIKDIFNQLDFNSLKVKFDIIFIDPPYKEKDLKSLLKKIIESNILSKSGIFIIHRHKKENDEFFSTQK